MPCVSPSAWYTAHSLGGPPPGHPLLEWCSNFMATCAPRRAASARAVRAHMRVRARALGGMVLRLHGRTRAAAGAVACPRCCDEVGLRAWHPLLGLALSSLWPLQSAQEPECS